MFISPKKKIKNETFKVNNCGLEMTCIMPHMSHDFS